MLPCIFTLNNKILFGLFQKAIFFQHLRRKLAALKFQFFAFNESIKKADLFH